jgi:hypothetical protein
MQLTAEEFDTLHLRRSQEDMNLVIDVLLNDGELLAPDSSATLTRAQADQEAEREADREAGGEGLTSWEKRAAQREAEIEEREAAVKAAEKEAAAAEKAAKASEKDAEKQPA